MISNNYQIWLDNLHNKDEIKKIKALTPEERKLAFDFPFTFGTAGIRAKLGLGSSLLNFYTIRKLGIAYFNYLKKQGWTNFFQSKGIVIFHDNRHYSKEFTFELAALLSERGVTVFLAPNNDLKPTPLMSFTIREIGALGGIIITASHNPKQYNGFKVYGSEGQQLLPKETNLINNEVKKINDKDVLNLKITANNNLIKPVPDEIEHNYVNCVKSLALNSSLEKKTKVTFSSQHGTSYKLVPQILSELGYEVVLVEKQCVPDPNFTYTITANPELPESFNLAKTIGSRTKSDIIVMTDPDADRMGVAVWNNNEYVILNGNQVASLFVYYKLNQLKERGHLSSKLALYTTFVSGELPSEIAKSFDVKTFLTPTGFKWMAAAMEENKKLYNFFFSFEQAVGYLIDDFVYDKDGLQAATLIVDLVNYYKVVKKKNILTVLDEIYEKYGYYHEEDISFTLDHPKSKEIFDKVMETFTQRRINTLAEYLVLSKHDFSITPPRQEYKCNLIKIYFEFGWIAIRASGTEPKIKVYFSVHSSTKKQTQVIFQKLKTALSTIINTQMLELQSGSDSFS